MMCILQWHCAKPCCLPNPLPFLMYIFSDGEQADISPQAYENINVIAGTLKLYLRLLPIPLITFEAHPALMKAARKFCFFSLYFL